MKHHANPRFWRSYRGLPREVRRVADRAYELLKRDPSHPSLHFKKIGQFWSARVRLHHRALSVNPPKVRDYLLSREHVVGSAKARFFAQLGFDQQNWTASRDELYGFASQDAELGAATRFGQKYLVHGTITGPSGRAARVVIVWIILHGEDFPRFVTTYPEAAS